MIKEKIKNLYCGLGWADMKADKRTLLVIILIAFIFGVAIRFFIAYKQFGNELFMFNGAPIIKSPDGYFFAEGARDIIAGAQAPDDGRSATNRLVSQLTALIHYIVPGITFEWLIYSIPPVVASLLVIPVLMLGIEAGSALVGFFASLIAVSAIGFYYRTFAGYYDDDFLVLILPFFFGYGLVRHLRVKDYSTLVFTGVSAAIYSIAYGNANTIMMMMLLMYAIYVIRYDRKHSSHYLLLAVTLLAISGLPPLQKIVAVAVALFLFRKNANDIKTSLMSAAVAFSVFAFYGGLNGVFDRLNYYIFKPQANTDTMQLHFFSTLKTVAESQYSDFNAVFKNFSGNAYLFFAGLLGFIILLVKDKRFSVLLPLLLTGLLAVDGGTRFTPYGSPLLAIGLVYLLILGLSFVPKDVVRYPILSICVIAFMYPSYKEFKNFDPPSVVLSSEANTLNSLSKIIKPNDYIYSWWDYGYQNRYYTKAKTMSDGGAQEGGSVYIESMALNMPSAIFAANLLRDAAETKEKVLKNHLISKGSVLGDIMSYGANKESNPWALMSKMAQADYVGMPKTREVYWQMPFRMLQIFGVIQKFAATDPISGRMSTKMLYAITGDSSEDAKRVNFSNHGIVVDKETAMVEYMGQKFPLGSYMRVVRSADGATIAENKVLSQGSKVVLLYMASYNTYLVMDSETFMSNFIQMFVLGNYDASLFELVDDSQMMKVFRLKK